jgi:hypothetical protein
VWTGSRARLSIAEIRLSECSAGKALRVLHSQRRRKRARGDVRSSGDFFLPSPSLFFTALLSRSSSVLSNECATDMTISARQLAAIDLCGPDDIGHRLSVKANTLAMWRVRHADFPRPELVVSRVPLWRWSVVREWALTHGRAPEVRSGEVSAADLALAVDLLPKVKAQLVREVQASADAVVDLFDEPLARPPARKLARRDGKYVSNDGHASDRGEWDWWWSLSNATRDRCKPYFSDSPHACQPDQWACALAWRLGDDLERSMALWCQAVAVQEAAKLLARGQVPDFAFDAMTTYDVDAIFGEDGALELARAWTEQVDRVPDDLTELEPLPAELVEAF